MEKEKELPKRKPTRSRGFDYDSVGAYFLTICTENRKQILSRVGGDILDAPQSATNNGKAYKPVGGDVLDAPGSVELLPYGKIADKYINQMNAFYSDVEINQYVIMPNHIHIMLLVLDNGASRTSPPTRQHAAVSQFVSTFKHFCNKEYGRNIWQRYFNDHVIRNRQDYEEHLRYIYENPMRWRYDELYSD